MQTYYLRGFLKRSEIGKQPEDITKSVRLKKEMNPKVWRILKMLPQKQDAEWACTVQSSFEVFENVKDRNWVKFKKWITGNK